MTELPVEPGIGITRTGTTLANKSNFLFRAISNALASFFVSAERWPFKTIRFFSIESIRLSGIRTFFVFESVSMEHWIGSHYGTGFKKKKNRGERFKIKWQRTTNRNSTSDEQTSPPLLVVPRNSLTSIGIPAAVNTSTTDSVISGPIVFASPGNSVTRRF